MKGFLSFVFRVVLFSSAIFCFAEEDAELLPNADFKELFAAGWRPQYNKLASYKLVKDFSFKKASSVIEINNPETAGKAASLRCSNFSLPDRGKLNASIWAKGSGLMTIFLIPSDWKGESFKKTFPIGPVWKKYSFDIDMPKHSRDKKYFFRVDCSGQGKVFMGAPSLKIKALEKEVFHRNRYIGSVCRNLLVNPSFEFGWTGWQPRYFAPSSAEAAVAQIKASLPEIKKNAGKGGGNALYIPCESHVESLCMPIERGKTYAVSLDIKADKLSETKVFALDYKWKCKRASFKVGKDWKRYSFVFKWDQPCYFDELYLRIDAPSDAGILVDNVQFSEGTDCFYEAPPFEVGILSESNIYNKDEKTGFLLKAFPSGKNIEDCKVVLELKDYNGVAIKKMSYDFPNGKLLEQPLDLPTSRYGLFIINMKVLDDKGRIQGIGLGRYAVIRKVPADFQKHFSMGANVEPHLRPSAFYFKTFPIWERLGIGNIVAGYPGKYSTSLESPEFVRLYKRSINYFKRNGCNSFIRVLMPNSICRFALFNDFPAGDDLWRQFVGEIVKTYSDVASVFAFMGEINIYRMRESYRSKYEGVDLPPNGSCLMSPDKGFKYYKSAYEAAKEANPSVMVCGPSINGEDFPYVKSFMAQGAAKYMDIYGMDAYRAGPDTPEAYSDYMELRHILKSNGFAGPVINLEQYLGICPKGYLGAAERSRNYYTPWNQEPYYAGVIARNYVQHAAAGIVWINFLPQMSLYHPFVLQGGYPSMAAPASAAATVFLNKAGRGIRITETNDVKAFVFPEAEEGPLMVLYTPLNNAKGSIKIAEVKCAFDMMGNELSVSDIEKGAPLGSSPIYLRFAESVSLEKIKKLFAEADILGIGYPFNIQAIALGNNTLALDVTNRTNKTLSGAAEINQTPEAWETDSAKSFFKDLKSGEKRRILFKMKKMPLENLGQYKVAASVVSGDYFSGKKQTLSPMFADYMPESDIDAFWDGSKKASNWISIDSCKNLVYVADAGKDESLKAEFACAWNEQGFFLSVKVCDADCVFPSGSENIMYRGDSIQVYFDQLKDASPGRPVYNDNDVVYQIASLNGSPTAYLEQGPEGRYLGPGNTLQGVDKDVKAKILYRDGNLFYRIFFPWHILRYVKPKHGEALGFSLFVHDKDKNTQCGISLDSASPYKKPFLWKDLILKK